MSEKNTKMVVFTEKEMRKPLTQEQEAEIEVLKAMPDELIDVSDIPPLPRGWAKGAKRFEEVFRPRKQPISLRMDADVLEWLKAGGDGWQTRINAIVRERMLTERG